MRVKILARFLFVWVCLSSIIFAGIDTLAGFQKAEYNRLGEPYLRYLKAYLEVKYYIDKDLVKARELLKPMYDASYAMLPKAPRYLGSYYNAKAHIELQSGNQIAATNSFLISIDYLSQDNQEDGSRFSTELSYEYIDLANVYFSLELYSKAVPYYRNAVAEFSADNDNLGLATSLNNLGLVFEKQGKYDSAYICFSKGLSARQQVKSSDTCYYFGHSMKYMARVRLEQKQYDSCLALLKMAEAYTKGTSYYGAKYILVEIYDLYARYYIDRGDPAATTKYFDLAVQTAELHYQNQVLCETYQEMANYYFTVHDYQSATRYGEKALALALSKNFFNERLHALLLLGKINTMTGNKEKAISYIGQYDSLNDARKSFIVESGLDALRESVKNRETIYNHEVENRLLQQHNKTLLLTSIIILLALTSLASFLYLKYRIKTKTEKALIKTKDELLRINEVKDRLFSILAHDLRSPFTALIGFSDLLAEDYDSMETQEVKNIITSIHKVSRETYTLLENLLDWSRMQSNRMDCKPELMDLGDAVRPTVSLFFETAKQKHISIENRVSKQHFVYADPQMFSTILRNILSNAIKFSHPESTVKISSKGEPDGFTSIYIKDAGIGMDTETMQRILGSNSFYTTRGTQDEKGTGLGIMLCKEFIEKNGGFLHIESVSGSGTTFIIRLRAISPENTLPETV